MSEAPKTAEQLALEESRRVLAPPQVDPTRGIGWGEMPAAARATACLLALLSRRPLDRNTMRYDRVRGVVYVLHHDAAGAARFATREVRGTADDVLAVARAQFGHRAEEIRRLVRRG